MLEFTSGFLLISLIFTVFLYVYYTWEFLFNLKIFHNKVLGFLKIQCGTAAHMHEGRGSCG